MSIVVVTGVFILCWAIVALLSQHETGLHMCSRTQLEELIEDEEDQGAEKSDNASASHWLLVYLDRRET